MRTRMILLLALLMLLGAPGTAVQAAEQPSWTDDPLVAHGLGAIDGHTYTNTREAFEHNYSLGYRVFEVDLQLTSDGYLVSRHDWQPYLYRQFEQTAPEEGLRGEPLTLAQVKSLPVFGSYHILEFSELLDLLKTYPDVTFITDTKDTEPNVIEQQFKTILAAAHGDNELLRRIVPQVYNQEMYHQIDGLYPFASYIYTLYESPDTEQQVLEFVRHHDRVDVVTLPEFKANSRFLLRLQAAGLKTYVHTINDPGVMHIYLDKGTYGFYTDQVTHDQLAAATTPQKGFGTLLASSLVKFVIPPIVLPLLISSIL